MIFDNARYKNQFMRRFIVNRNDQVKELMIYTKNLAYDKLRYYQTTQQIIKQLHHKMLAIMDNIRNITLRHRLDPIIAQLIPNDIYLQKLRADINEDIIDFFQAYNIHMKTNSSQIKETLIEDIRPTSLKIPSKNIGGNLEAKIAATSALMMDIILYQPQIIMIQEHMLLNRTKAQFRKIFKIPGYTLMTHSKATETDGRPSGGLAIWVSDAMAASFKISQLKNTAYLQKISLKPRNTRDQPIHVSNIYCKPDWDIETVKQFLEETRPHQQEDNHIQVGMGDYNIRLPEIGDKKCNLHGLQLSQFIRKYDKSILNETLAHGIPTYQNYMNDGYNMPDIAIVPSNQKILWNKMYITATKVGIFT